MSELTGVEKSLFYDTSDPDFYDPAALDKEMRRIFTICNGCRLCFNLCPSFKYMFHTADEKDSIEKLDAGDHQQIEKLCYQCKLCYPKCPYTPPHEYHLDFPRLMMRARAVRMKENGHSLSDKMLGNPDTVGRMQTGLQARMINRMNRNHLHRTLMEKVLGIHRDRNLPPANRGTFARWFHKKRFAQPEEPVAKVALFYSCLVNYNYPEVGRALMAVFQHNNIEVVCPSQRCCGMPKLDIGDVQNTRDYHAGYNVKQFAAYIRQGYDIVVPEPTCSMMIKTEYPQLLDSEDARLVADHTYDLAEFLMKLKRENKLKLDFKEPPPRLAYHQPCHLKIQNMGNRSLELLRLLPGTKVEFINKGCCGVDGTWGFKKDYFEMSLQVGSGMISGMQEAQSGDMPAQPVADCSFCGLQIEKGAGLKTLHPIEVIALAYGLEMYD